MITGVEEGGFYCADRRCICIRLDKRVVNDSYSDSLEFPLQICSEIAMSIMEEAGGFFSSRLSSPG